MLVTFLTTSSKLNIVIFQSKVQARRKEDECQGSIWDCLPICEKEKDEINFNALSSDVSRKIGKHFDQMK